MMKTMKMSLRCVRVMTLRYVRVTLTTANREREEMHIQTHKHTSTLTHAQSFTHTRSGDVCAAILEDICNIVGP